MCYECEPKPVEVVCPWCHESIKEGERTITVNIGGHVRLGHEGNCVSKNDKDVVYLVKPVIKEFVPENHIVGSVETSPSGSDASFISPVTSVSSGSSKRSARALSPVDLAFDLDIISPTLAEAVKQADQQENVTVTNGIPDFDRKIKKKT